MVGNMPEPKMPQIHQSKNFIQGAITRPGAFSQKAEHRHMTTEAFIEHVLSHKTAFDHTTIKEAELAKTLSKLRPNK